MNSKDLSPGPSVGGMGYSLVYDGGCGPCSAFKALVAFLDPGRRLRFVPLADAERAGMLSTIRADLRWRSFHLVSSDGAATSGARALPLLASFLPAGRVASKALSSCPPLNSAAAFGFSVLSRMHDRGDCSLSAGSRFVES